MSDTITKQDLFGSLKNHPKAAEAIFWWCFCWHSGAGSDLYTIMCDETLGYRPNPNDNVQIPDVNHLGGFRTEPRWSVDPEIHDLFAILDNNFGPIVNPGAGVDPDPYRPIMLRDVREGQVLIAGTAFGCVTHRWPCRVIRQGSVLGVTCSERFHGIDLQPGSEGYFHSLTEDSEGYVIGFRR